MREGSVPGLNLGLLRSLGVKVRVIVQVRAIEVANGGYYTNSSVRPSSTVPRYFSILPLAGGCRAFRTIGTQDFHLAGKKRTRLLWYVSTYDVQGPMRVYVVWQLEGD